jgi:hypothetical protein
MGIRCPHLNEKELCSIYETRPSCCRNFPNLNKGMFCSDSYKRCVYDSLGNLNCANCKDKCCNHLEMKTFDIKLLNISCVECKEKYCNKDK